MIELKEDNLKEIVENTDKVIVQYGASWCGNCRIVKPKFRKLSEQYTHINFVYVDAEKFPNSRKLSQVNNLPSFTTFKEGEVLDHFEGNKIDKVESLIAKI